MGFISVYSLTDTVIVICTILRSFDGVVLRSKRGGLLNYVIAVNYRNVKRTRILVNGKYISEYTYVLNIKSDVFSAVPINTVECIVKSVCILNYELIYCINSDLCDKTDRRNVRRGFVCNEV